MSDIVVAPDPVLRQKAKPVTKIDKKILSILADMEKALIDAKDPQGVGLAAPQIGLSLRIFLMRPDTKQKPQIFINPEITSFSKKLQSPEDDTGVYEGCLSIPNHYAPLKRSETITLKYQTPVQKDSTFHLESKSADFSGFEAHIIQHEVDHLNGTLFTDRVLEQKTRMYKVKGKSWEEVDL